MNPASDAFQPRYLVPPGGSKFRAALFGAAEDGPARGVCVLLNGQSEFIEKYFDVIDELRARGFSVATLDWQNQGGSPRALADPLKVHVRDFGEYDAVLDTLLNDLVAPVSSAPPIALAHSMGGHILLRHLHRNPKIFAAAVFSAPMLGIATRGLPLWFVTRTARAMANARAEDWVWGVNSRDPLTARFENNPVTSDRTRWDKAHDFLQSHPEMRVVGPSWSWLAAALSSMAEMTQPAYANAITTPSLFFGAGRDSICVTPVTRAFAARMPNAKYIELPGARHEILMESDAIRNVFWTEFDSFTAQIQRT